MILSILDTPSLRLWFNFIQITFSESNHIVATTMEDISVIRANMPANPNGLGHEVVTSSTSIAMIDLPLSTTAGQTQMPPTQADSQTHLQRGSSADFVQDIQP